MSRKFITGDDQIERSLRYLSDKAGDRVAKSAMGAALNVFRRAIRKAAPVVTGETRRSIGRRLERHRRTGQVTAKVGVDVAKTRKGHVSKQSEHAYLVALKRHFVPQAYAAARAMAQAKMRDAAAKRLLKEAAKARKGG